MTTLSRKIREARELLEEAFGEDYDEGFCMRTNRKKVDYASLVDDKRWPPVQRWLKIYTNALLEIQKDQSRIFAQRSEKWLDRVVTTCDNRLGMLLNRVVACIN